jgi:murein DD-endopeptidase MepM/ murein hydrolase activator NlpD
MAVDIINVRNILTVTADNSIVRFPGEPGSAVAAADGVVIESGFNSVYGWFAEISHGTKPEWRSRYRDLELLSTYYSHLAEDPGWKEGDRILRNEKVGKIGDTGRATGPHLHFEVRVYRPGGEFEKQDRSFRQDESLHTGRIEIFRRQNDGGAVEEILNMHGNLVFLPAAVHMGIIPACEGSVVVNQA